MPPLRSAPFRLSPPVTCFGARPVAKKTRSKTEPYENGLAFQMAIPIARLEDLARARLTDAEIMRDHGRYDGGLYLCGYAVELALKARICKTLNWAGFPETQKELRIFKQLQSHDLAMLLTLTGQERRIRAQFTTEWSYIAARWSPEMRYEALGVPQAVLDDAIAATRVLVSELL